MPDAHAQPTSGSQTAAISNMVVGLLSQYTGRGPTKAKTYVNDDLITVLLQDAITHAERSLVADGETELVLSVRKTFQSTMSKDLIAGVERITGRRVTAFFSDNHVDPDVSIEAFVLAPLFEDAQDSREAVAPDPPGSPS